MKKIIVTVSTDKVGSQCANEFEVEDDATEEDIDRDAREMMFEMIEWNWSVRGDGA